MAALVVLQAAQLGFISPNGLLGPLEPGSQVNVSWNSPWPLTTLEIWRGPSEDDGSFNVNTLGANLPPVTTTYSYMVPAVDSEENAFSPQVYFRLQKSDVPNLCGTCVATSPTFQIAAAGAIVAGSATPPASESIQSSTPGMAATSAAEEGIATSSAPSMESESAASMTTETASMTMEAPTSTAAEATTSVAPEAASTMAESSASSAEQSTPSGMTTMVASNTASVAQDSMSTTSPAPYRYTPIGSKGFDHATELGLGIGLGLGIPLMLVIMGLLVCCLNRRDRRRLQEKQFEGVSRAP